jgi:16S rRNA (guanine966-N2)-methyltransferase
VEWQDPLAGTPDRLQTGELMSLRIVAGEFGGRRIGVPPGRQVRPTGERVREAWFSALGDRVGDASVVDLFAGSGALGIEALSRGAATVHFVEEDRRCFDALRDNIESLEISARTRLHRGDVFTFLSRLGDEPRFDLALADPPYRRGIAARLVGEFRRRPFAQMLCVEHGVDEPIDSSPIWERRYGETVLSFHSAPKGGDTGD